MDRTRTVFEKLLAHYGPQRWWPAETPFEVVVGALLMPQTTWRNVAVAIENLKSAGLLDVRSLASEALPVLRKHVRTAGLYRSKPARLRDFCRHLLKRSDGDLVQYFRRSSAEVRADLLAQSGVGPETADSILLYAGGHPAFVVDAYTIRIGTRIGLFSTNEYDTVQRFFRRRIRPDVDRYREYHALLVAHAKALCRPRPRCDACPLQSICNFGRRRGRTRRVNVQR